MSAQKPLIIFGTGRFAEEVAELAGESDEYELVGFGEHSNKTRAGSTLVGHPIYWIDDLASLAASHYAVCALGTTRRSTFIRQVETMGFRFGKILHPAAICSSTTTIEEGSIISTGAIMATRSTIGRHVIVNRAALIGHHSSIGDYVTISPGANIAGSVSIGDGTYIGIGAVILNNLSVGSNAIIGAGAVVTKDVPDNVQVVGVPAKITRRNVVGL